MLTIGKLAPGMVEYYERQVALGVEEYYTGAKEAPGQWLGRGAELLALSGEVDAEHLHRVLEHVDPHGGFNLTGGRSAPTVAGFDATFSAPKSVSLLYALGDGETSNVVRNAHDNALRAAFGFYEQQASFVRRGHAGETVQAGEGLVAAEFRHRTSRAGDPQLHTHVVIANVARSSEDGRWSALFARPGIYGWARPVGHLYQAQLRYELSNVLGVDWTPVRNGTAEVRGFARDHLREFSHRRVEIETHLEAHGESSAKAAQLAAYATRQAKDPNATPENLFATWRTRANEIGLDPNALAATLHKTQLQLPGAVDSVVARSLYDHLAGPDGLTRERATFGRGEVICAICDALPHGAPVAKVLAMADTFLRHKQVLALPAADGIPIRWTTTDMVQEEATLLARIERQHDRGVTTVPPVKLDTEMARWPGLSDEQRQMVAKTCGDGDGVAVVAGLAGSGKTTALAASVDAWTGAGYHVTGVALAARTAAALGDVAGIDAMSITRYLHAVDTGQLRVGTNDVVVVDEAGMVGTRTLNRLAAITETAGAKLVLVGDPYQLPELEAGGLYRHLTTQPAAVALTENRRQHEPWERAALAELRVGEPSAALDAYRTHGRVHEADSLNDARRQLVTDWHATFAAGEDAVMIAATNHDVDALNRLARQQLQADGRLGRDVIDAGGRCFAVGDRAMTLRNDRRLAVFNGVIGTITNIDTARETVTIRTAAPLERTVPFAYIADGGLTHAYALTLHKAQGVTVDRAFILAADGLAREHAYTALSRGRLSNDLYAGDPEPRSEVAHSPEITGTQQQQIEAAIARVTAQQPATDALRRTVLVAKDREEEVRDRIGYGPPDRTLELRDATKRLHEERQGLAQARWREQRAREELNDLGPVGRRLRPTATRDARRRLETARTDIDRHEHALVALGPRVEELGRDVAAREAWKQERAPELSRIASIRLQHELERLGLDPARPPKVLGRDRGVDHGIDLGL